MADNTGKEMHTLKHLRQEAPSHPTREMDENPTSSATGAGTSGGFGSFRPFSDNVQDPPPEEQAAPGHEDDDVIVDQGQRRVDDRSSAA